MGAPDVVGQRDSAHSGISRRVSAPTRSGSGSPQDGTGRSGATCSAIPRNAKNPVLAHHFLNYLLDVKNGYSNFANYVGYQPPLTKLDPDKLVADGVVPSNLRTAIVRESDFDRGFAITELTPTGQADWQNAWAEFKAGV